MPKQPVKVRRDFWSSLTGEPAEVKSVGVRVEVVVAPYRRESAFIIGFRF